MKLLIVLEICCLSGCATNKYLQPYRLIRQQSRPKAPLLIYPASPPAKALFHIMAFNWKVKDFRYPRVKLDLTYLVGSENPVICNISFVQNKKTPQAVSAASFVADGTCYPLEDISVLVFSPQENTLRISSNLRPEHGMVLLDAGSIVLEFTLDNVNYQAEAPNVFYTALKQAAEGLLYYQ
ncbi:MAG: hypothetical protein LBL28_00235 [Treponema sp.]|nr:hypothetical protein [Treponema sp.]